MSATQLLEAVNGLSRREHGAFLDALVEREREELLRRLEDAEDVAQARKVLVETKPEDWIPHAAVKSQLGWK